MAQRDFRQIRAHTRAERVAVSDKAGKEKELLKARPGNNVVYDEPITEPPRDSIAYAGPSERFQQGFAAKDKESRIEKMRQQEINITHRRHLNAEREEQRWAQIDSDMSKEEDKWERFREEGSKSKRNDWIHRAFLFPIFWPFFSR